MVAPWYKRAFLRDGIRAPRTAGYGLASPDHHWLVATQPELTVSVKLQMDVLALMRWQALLSVEDIRPQMRRSPVRVRAEPLEGRAAPSCFVQQVPGVCTAREYSGETTQIKAEFQYKYSARGKIAGIF